MRGMAGILKPEAELGNAARCENDAPDSTEQPVASGDLNLHAQPAVASAVFAEHVVMHGFYVLDSLRRFVAWCEHIEEACTLHRKDAAADTVIRASDGTLVMYRGGKAFGRTVRK